MEITRKQYEFALHRVEELLPQVDDTMPATDARVAELAAASDVVEAYEKEHYPI